MFFKIFSIYKFSKISNCDKIEGDQKSVEKGENVMLPILVKKIPFN